MATKDFCDTCGKHKFLIEFKETINICRKCIEELHTQTNKPKYKKYIVFGIEGYYPAGGLGDVSASFDTLKEAKKHGDTLSEQGQCVDVVNRDTWKLDAQNLMDGWK